MTDLQPLFTSTYSLGAQSILTLDEAGKAKPGAAQSVFDCVKDGGLKEVVLCEDKMDGYLHAFKTATKMGVKLCFGLKLTVCANMLDKTPESARTESKVIIFARDGRPDPGENLPRAYRDLIRIHNRAANEGRYEDKHRGVIHRADWDLLGAYWTDNLTLALPFFSSFIARNTLTFNPVVPRLPVDAKAIWVFKEQGSELPFEGLLNAAVDRYAAGEPRAQVVPVKSVYYMKETDFEQYIVMRAIATRSTFDAPNAEHLSSPTFNWQAYKALVAVREPGLVDTVVTQS